MMNGVNGLRVTWCVDLVSTEGDLFIVLLVHNPKYIIVFHV